MFIKEKKYCYDDISIVPAIKSNIEHRSNCNPFLPQHDNYLPIFTAPMSTVVNKENFALFEENHIIPILPRNFDLETRIEYLKLGKWAAVGLQEFEDLFLNNDWDFELYPHVNVLIDIANGHMEKLHCIIYDAKVKYKWSHNFKIMAGNIANPLTYVELAKAGCDYVRVGIGGGSGCFVKGTQITMADGTKQNIEDIDKGDFVLTINGPQKVTNTFVKNKQDTIIINNEIECTLDHKFFVVRKTDVTQDMTDEEIKEKGFYVEAQYLCEDYLLVMD